MADQGMHFRAVRAGGMPIQRRDGPAYALFYAPGYVCVVDRAEADRFAEQIGPTAPAPEARELWQRAEAAVVAAQRQQEEPFRPECLTLYLNNECALHCRYCYATPSAGPATRLGEEAIVAAAELVAANCRQKGLPLHVVFHGGGEPTLHLERVESVLARLEAVATRHGVGQFRYIATGGVLSERAAVWLARRFDLIGLSCDGPPEIQNAQRPRHDGRGTAHIVERTARILHAEGRRFHVRATITAQTLHRQAEIAAYLCQELRPAAIHFEPAYRGGRAAELEPDQAASFVAHFLEAQKLAQGYGVPLSFSGSRPGEVHGPYCHVFRQVLNLVPGGVATACFKITRAEDARERGLAIGAWRENGCFDLDIARVDGLRQRLGMLPGACAECFNRYHCARACPDHCPLDSPAGGIEGFRCRVQRWLTEAVIERTARRLWAERGQRRIYAGSL